MYNPFKPDLIDEERLYAIGVLYTKIKDGWVIKYKKSINDAYLTTNFEFNLSTQPVFFESEEEANNQLKATCDKLNVDNNDFTVYFMKNSCYEQK